MVQEMLDNLKKRLHSQNEAVEFFVIDNCCKWRKKIHELFGPNVRVCLDIFHAVQRITKAINKQHRFYSDCVQDLSKVYRSDDDTGKTKREKPTPDPATIIRNLDRFAEKWQHISDTQLTDDPLLRESFQEQVQNLRQHINEGCLSGIPPGYSTSINECLHEKINDLFAGAKMGPELAVALLTVFFFSWNSRRKNKINGVPVVVPLSQQTHKSTQSEETFGIGKTAKKGNDDINVSGNLEEPQGPIRRALSMLSFLNTVNTKANRRCDINLYQLFFEADIVKYMLKNSGGGNLEPDKSRSVVATVAEQFGMELHPMPRDGDCFFKAMGFNVLNVGSHSALKNHFTSLGLIQIDNIEEMAIKLRAMMVHELVYNKEKYVDFVQEYGMQEWEERVKQFLQPGVFSGEVGDLMVKATVNVLKIPLILLTSIENYPVINVTPDEFAEGCSDFCLFAAYSREGPGHYDALFENQQRMETVEEVSAKPTQRCTCGMNSKEVKNVCCKRQAGGSRQYASRCPCLKVK